MNSLLCLGIFLLSWLLPSLSCFAQTHHAAARSEERRGKGFWESDNPARRLEHEWLKARDPISGNVPERVAERERAFAERLPVRYPFADAKGGGSLQASLQWRFVGPANVSGRTRAVAIDRSNERNILLGSASGGVWRSIDAGASWARASAPNEITSVTCLAQDARKGKENVWYYGTGELLSTTDRRVTRNLRTIAPGNGIFKSTDAGASWKRLASTQGGSPAALSEHFQGVWNIVADPARADSDVVYAACYGGVLRSADGGGTWNLVLGDASAKSFCSDVAVTSKGVLYAALGTTENGSIPSKQGVWRSTDGLTWTNVTPANFPSSTNPKLIRRIRLAVAPSNENVVYVTGEAPSNWANRYTSFGSRSFLWKYSYLSNDGSGTGGAWENRAKGLEWFATSTLGGYCFAIAVKPDNENVLFLAGNDLFRSDNAFLNEDQITVLGGYPFNFEETSMHPDVHALTFPPSNPNKLYVGHDGGLSLAANAMENQNIAWKNFWNGYASTQFYSVALDKATPGDNFVIGGLQDNSTFYTTTGDAAKPWTLAISGDGTGCAVANKKSGIYYASQSGWLSHFTLDAKGQPAYSAFGYSIEDLHDRLPFTYFNFVSIFALEPNDNKQLYLPAENRLFRYADLTKIPKDSASAIGDPQWQEITEIGSLVTEDATISAIAISTKPANRLYIGTNDGRLFRIDKCDAAAPVVATITDVNFPRGGFVASIDIDPDDADKVLLAFSNYNVQSVFYTSNAGTSWSAVGGNLEDNPDGGGVGPSIRCVKFAKSGGRTAYFAGTSIGLFSATNLAGTQTVWAQEGATTIGNVMVEALDSRASDGRVVVGTHGAGIFTADIVTSARVEAPPQFFLESPFPNPARDRTSVQFELSEAAETRLVVCDALGREAVLVESERRLAGKHRLELDLNAKPYAALPSGAYFLRLEASGQAQTRAFVIAR